MARTTDCTDAHTGLSTRCLRVAAALLLATGLNACAGGTNYREFVRTAPALNPNFGRIFFFRPSGFARLLKPSVTLNGRTVGTIRPTGFFYLDRPPGEYEVGNSANRRGNLSLTLRGGQNRFVRFIVVPQSGFSPLVVNELAEPRSALAEIGDCEFDAQSSENAALDFPRDPPRTPPATREPLPKKASPGSQPELEYPSRKTTAPPPPAASHSPGSALPPPPPLD